jgi:hypothetical protein
MTGRRTTPGRIPCLNPRCNRTAPAEKFPGCEEIICGKCWKLLPKRVRDRYRWLNQQERRMLRHIERRVAKGEISRGLIATVESRVGPLKESNWAEIRGFFLEPDKPEGLDAFLEEMGLT